jgi:hypothetical protein
MISSTKSKPNNIIQYTCDGKIKSIPIEKVEEKHFPPRPEGYSVDETPENMQYIYSYISNSLQNECEEKLRPQKEARQRQLQEKFEREQNERAQRLADAEARSQSLPLLAQLDRLESNLRNHRYQEKPCQDCYRLQKLNHSRFVDSSLSITRNIRRQYQNEQQQKASA